MIQFLGSLGAAAALGRFSELPGVQVAIGDAMAIAAIITLSKTHDPEAQRHAARALGNLAGNAQCQKQIGASGGVRPLVKSGCAPRTTFTPTHTLSPIAAARSDDAQIAS